MKKTTLFASAAVLLGLASCSQEEMFTPNAADGNVSFTVSMPGNGFNTRSFADGFTATDLEYAVYDAETNNFVGASSVQFPADSRSTNVNISLANGRAYRIAFFAHKKAQSVYTFNADAETPNFKVDYSKMTDYNTSDFDCFYQIIDVPVVTGAVNENVTLYRPLAQVNWGTSDLAEAAVVADNAYGAGAAKLVTKAVTTSAYNQFNLLDNDVELSSETTVTFPHLARPDAAKESFPVQPDTYEYLSMNWLLVPKAGINAELTLEATNAAGATALSTVSVPNAPIQANYRTNIYGALLTSPADFTVTKDQNFDVEVNISDDQLIAQGLYYNAAAKTYTITEKEGLINFSAMMNDLVDKNTANSGSLEGKTVRLVADIDLDGVDWTPFNNGHATFDGCGHTISNLNVDKDDTWDMVGFMTCSFGTVKNLNFKNATVKGYYKAGVLAGDGICTTVENVHVDGAEVISTPRLNKDGVYDDANNVGGIIGFLDGEPKASIKNCSVSNAKIQAYRKVGGIAGAAVNGTTIVSGCSVSNVEVIADMRETNYDGYEKRIPQAAEVAGATDGGSILEGNQIDNVTITVLRAE